MKEPIPKYFIFILLSVFLHTAFYAQQTGIQTTGFTVSVETGITGGKIDEIVTQYGKDLSLLEWQEAVNPFVQTSFNYEYFFKAGKGISLTATLGLKTVLPVISGVIKDYDYNFQGQISNFSAHYSKQEKNLEGNFFAGIKFPLSKFTLGGALGFSYKTKLFRGLEGYTQYPEHDEIWTGKEEKKYLSGTVLTYTQDYYIPALNVSGAYDFTKNISLGISIFYYPYGFINATDTHHLKDTIYYDYIRGVTGIKGETFFNLYFSPSKYFPFSNLALVFDYEFLYGKNGKNYQTTTGSYSGEPVMFSSVIPKTKLAVWSVSLRYY